MTANWQEALQRTRRAAFARVASLLGANELDDEFWEALETNLIRADVGVRTSLALVDELRQKANAEAWRDGLEASGALRQSLLARLPSPVEAEIDERPHVILMAGVNGSGKTTTVARLARRYQRRGHRVMVTSADTYRAAAQEQLAVWAERLDADFIPAQPDGDPGAVVYNAAEAARARGSDVLIADTSGRMHTSHNLMAELTKVCRVAAKVVDGAPHQALLVMDATTGQNALSQARGFAESMPVSGVVLAKLDTSARGGIGLAIVSELGLPIVYVGLGETIDDLALFDPVAYVDGLLARPEGEPAS